MIGLDHSDDGLQKFFITFHFVCLCFLIFSENDIVKENLDVQLFEESIFHSFNKVSLLVELQKRLDIEVSISDFNRDKWETPNMIC